MSLLQETRGKKQTENQLTVLCVRTRKLTNDPRRNYSDSWSRGAHTAPSFGYLLLPGCQVEEEDTENFIPLQYV